MNDEGRFDALLGVFGIGASLSLLLSGGAGTSAVSLLYGAAVGAFIRQGRLGVVSNRRHFRIE